MKRYKVTVYIEDNIESYPSTECAIGGMVDRVLELEFKTNKKHGRPAGYVDCKLYEMCEVVEVEPPKPKVCRHCDGTGEVRNAGN